MLRFNKYVVAIAAITVLSCGAAAAQGVLAAIGVIREGAVAISDLVNGVRDTYRAVKYVVDAGGQVRQGDFDHIADPEERRRAEERARLDALSGGITRLERQLTEISRLQEEIIGVVLVTSQKEFYGDSYAHSRSALLFVEEVLAAEPADRARFDDRLQTHLDRVTQDAFAAKGRQPDQAGGHYVAALNATATALAALRSIDGDAPGSVPEARRRALAEAVTDIEASLQLVTAPNSFLNETARAEAAEYRRRIGRMAGRDAFAPMVSGTRFYERGVACFEMVERPAPTRPCNVLRGECPPIGPSERVVTGPATYRQMRYAFHLPREQFGELGLVAPMQPDVTPTSATTQRVVENCPQRGDAERAWLRMVQDFNTDLLEATPYGARAAVAIGALELAESTRRDLAALRAKL